MSDEKIRQRPDGKIEILEQFYNGGEEYVIYRPSPDIVGKDVDKSGLNASLDGWGFYPALNQRTYLFEGLQVDQDVPIKLRDGITIYADLIRPANQLFNLPTIIAWGFYGKRPADGNSSWTTLGVPPETMSSNAKFEGPDPGFWCNQGYAVLNVDSRGSGNSEGNLVVWGEQDGRDCYDAVEWVAAQPWSNQRVTFMGNSSLCMCQWFAAAERPPHLTCLSAWEGTSDLYREFAFEGGIPETGFNNFVTREAGGPGYIEDYVAMMAEHPTMDAYWQSKIPRWEEIPDLPIYMTAGWSHFHLRGVMNAWRKIKSARKWLRVHREFEWPDTYTPGNLQELKLFLDRYMKDVHNGWELTPKVRIEVMDAYNYDYQVNRPENEFPLKRTKYTKLYLNAADGSLNREPVDAESCCKYDGNTGEVTFDITFDEDTELTGYSCLHTYVAAEEHDDADIFLTLMKLDEDGEWIPTSVLGEDHPGAWGKIRISHRALDEDLSTRFNPVMSHKEIQKVEPGQIVPIDVEFYPTSRIWHKGEKLRLRLAGRYIREGWFEPFHWETDNVGNTVIYTGGEHQSWLQIPVVPAKHQTKSGYVYR